LPANTERADSVRLLLFTASESLTVILGVDQDSSIPYDTAQQKLMDDSVEHTFRPQLCH